MFFRADHDGRAELCGRTFGVWSPGTQLRIPTSQLLEMDARLFSPLRPACKHAGSVGLRDAVWAGLSQSGAVARWAEICVRQIAGIRRQQGTLPLEFSLPRTQWSAGGGGDRRAWFKRASSSVCKDGLHGQLRSLEQ